MRRSIKIATILFLLAVCAGCATNWPVQMDTNITALDKKGIILATVTATNTREADDLMEVVVMMLDKDGKTSKYWWSQSAHLSRKIFLRAPSSTDDSRLLVLLLDEGEYSIQTLRGVVRGDFFTSLFEAPLLSSFSVKQGEITYIGNIELVLRKKADETDLRAGPILPLVPQIQMKGVTFDVNISNLYEKDSQDFYSVFPSLIKHEMKQQVMPPWRRPSKEDVDFNTSGIHFF